MTQITYTIGDYLIRLKNTALAGKREVVSKETKIIKEVAKVLKIQGYLEQVNSKDGLLESKLAYRNKKPVLFKVRLVSRPGLRVYKSADDLEDVKGPSILIVTTSKGVMTHKEAIKARIGGEVIAEVY
jgi:small subunit ribosomal protein S8